MNLYTIHSFQLLETESAVPGNYFFDRLIADLYPCKETSWQ